MEGYVSHPLYIKHCVSCPQMSEVKVVENPINISYGPSLVEPHMDVSQYESHPGLVLLHCLR